MHKVLPRGISLPRKSVSRLNDQLDMTSKALIRPLNTKSNKYLNTYNMTIDKYLACIYLDYASIQNFILGINKPFRLRHFESLAN